jgi:hypothetical protein
MTPHADEAVAVIRRRDRSDDGSPGIAHFPCTGQQLTWHQSWKHTPVLAGDRLVDWGLAKISRTDPEQPAVGLAACRWLPDAAGLPWVRSAGPR